MTDEGAELNEDEDVDTADEVEEIDALVATPELDATRLDAADDRPAVGSWWWVSGRGDHYKKSEYDRPGKLWLACVIEVGSNYAKVRGVRFSQRIALDHFHALCGAERDPQSFISSRVDLHRQKVRALMGEIEIVCRRLGVPMRQSLARESAGESSQALAVVHSVADTKVYRSELVKAKEKTLPDLFRQVEEQHKEMAKWMQAELIPAEATLSATRESISVIQGKIDTVDLYAGLSEELACVREGGAAAEGERVRIMQRMHYMDEECLAQYESGGMDFRDVGQFDAWLARDGNFARIFPSRRCIVAFRIRRHRKDYGDLGPFISFHFNEANRQTFLYVRNGEQLHRLMTSIDFGEQLFPDQQSSDLLGDQKLWIKSDEHDIERGTGIITERRRNAMIDEHRRRRRSMAMKLWQWKRAGKPSGQWTYVVSDDADLLHGRHKPGDSVGMLGCPDRDYMYSGSIHHAEHLRYEPLTPDHIFFDDATRRIQRVTTEHNRIAVVVQGLLDRSTCLHPHPPWKIWTTEGFTSGVELSYDVTRAIAPGDAPDFEAYRQRLNLGIKPGCHTIGQRDAWRAHMAKRHGDRWWQYERYGKGPEHVHRVDRVLRNGSCEFRWTRQQVTPKWVPNPERPGYLKATYPELPCTWVCPPGELTCVDAYTPGDFHLFFDDPRTRADYLEWAPILLACEDWHAARRAERREEQEPKAKRKKQKERS